MCLVIVFKPMRQLFHHRLRIRQIIQVHVITFKRFYKSLCHAIALWAADRRCTNNEAQIFSKFSRLFFNVATAVICQPLEWLRYARRASKSILQAFHQQILDHLAVDAASGRHISHNFPITTIQTKGHADNFFVPAPDLKSIRAPAHIRLQCDDLAIMTALINTSRVPWQQQFVLLHDSVHAFVIDRWLVSRTAQPVQARCHATITVAGPAGTDLYDRRQQGLISALVIFDRPACMTPLQSINQVRARDLQHLGDTFYRESSGGSNGVRDINFFDCATSSASRRISASMVLRPSMRSSSRTRLISAFTSDALTTSSPDSMAEYPPSFISFFHLNNRLADI